MTTIVRRAVVATLLLAAPQLIRAQGAAASQEFVQLHQVRILPPMLAMRVSFQFDGVMLRDAVDSVARRAGISFVADRALAGLDRPVTLRARDVSAASALERILAGSGITALLSPTGQLVLVAAPKQVKARFVLRGVTRDAESGAPIEGVRVEIPVMRLAVITKESGRFELSLPESGVYSIRASRLGYRAVFMPYLPVNSESAPELDVPMTRAAVALESVVITPGTFGIMQKGVAAAQAFSREQIEAAPQIGEDIYRAVNRLPGIAADDFSSDFRVRGGDGAELYTTLDGVELTRPFHLQDLGGAFSIIDVKSIGAVDLTVGGLTADIGNRLTGAFALHSMEPLTDRVHTSVGVSLMNVRAQAQGGLGDGKGGWLASYRRGYLDIALKLASAGDSLDPRYDDAFVKAHYDLPSSWFIGGRVAVHVLHAGDNLNYQEKNGAIRSRYASDYTWLTWNGNVGHSEAPDETAARLRQSTVVSATRTTQRRVGAIHDERTIDGSVNDDRSFSALSARQDWTLAVSSRLMMRWGADASRERARYVYDNSIVRDSAGARQDDGVRPRISYVASTNVAIEPTSTRTGVYTTERFRLFEPLTVEAGVRYDRNSATNDASVLPRLNAVWEAASGTSLRAAWGRTSQSQSVGMIRVEDGARDPYPAKRAEHVIVGVDHLLNGGVLGRIELYQRNQSALWPYGASNADGDVPLIPELTWDRVHVAPSIGRARGIEFLLRRQHGETLDWMASYALAEAREQVNGEWLPSQADQRHAVNFDLSFHPPDGRWRLSAALTWHSGWPYTTTFVRVDTVARTATSYRLAGYIVDDVYNGATLPAYKRIDVRWMRFIDTQRWHGSVFAEVYNVFNTNNPRGYYNYVEFDGRGGYYRRQVDNTSIPRLPAIGLSWDF